VLVARRDDLVDLLGESGALELGLDSIAELTESEETLSAIRLADGHALQEGIKRRELLGKVDERILTGEEAGEPTRGSDEGAKGQLAIQSNFYRFSAYPRSLEMVNWGSFACSAGV
jgi:hypothetical protein